MRRVKLKSKKAFEALSWLCDIFRKHQAPYQITGGLAANIYGSKRELFDIDIDMCDQSIEEILSDIRQYITYGPARYKDDQWDILLMTLSYAGQQIDVTGSDDGKIFDHEAKKWVNCHVDLSMAREILINELPVCVIDKKELIQYKSILKRDVDLADIKAIRRDLSSGCGNG